MVPFYLYQVHCRQSSFTSDLNVRKIQPVLENVLAEVSRKGWKAEGPDLSTNFIFLSFPLNLHWHYLALLLWCLEREAASSSMPVVRELPGASPVCDKAMKNSTCVAVGVEDMFLDMLRFRKTGPLLPLSLPAASWCCVRQDRGWPHPAPGPWLLWWSRGHGGPADMTATSPHISARWVSATEGKGCRDALTQIGAWCMDVTGARYMEGSIAWH